MNILTKTIISLAVVFATPIALACDYPSRPDTLPDGATASKDDMMAGVKVINEYQSAMSEYLSCMEADQIVAAKAIDETDDKAKKQQKEMFNKKYNAAVDEQTLVVEEFNAQIRAYKAQSK